VEATVAVASITFSSAPFSSRRRAVNFHSPGFASASSTSKSSDFLRTDGLTKISVMCGPWGEDSRITSPISPREASARFFFASVA
jgi:hypothetical protein